MRLTPDADRLWIRLRNEPALAGFVLIGGSALALHLGHRISEDLDFALRGLEDRPALQLPRIVLKSLLSDLRSAGASVEDRFLSAADVRDFEAAGMDPEDFQQEYLIDKVKVSFFVPEEPLATVLRPGNANGPRLAEEEELFQTKALVTASRSKTRDWFDLYYLMTERGYTMEDFVRTFERTNSGVKLDIALRRLCSGQPSIADEGFSTLAGHAPSLAEMTNYFRRERDRVEIERARRARPT